MKTLLSENTRVILEADFIECATILNALNEVCNGIEMIFFENQIGFPREKVTRLLSEVHSAIKDI